MRALKFLVIALGVLLVGGTVALVVAIIARTTHPTESVAESRSAAPARGPAYEATLDLPPGARVISVQPAGDRLVLHLALSDGHQQIVILDLGSGVRRGTIELRPTQ